MIPYYAEVVAYSSRCCHLHIIYSFEKYVRQVKATKTIADTVTGSRSIPYINLRNPSAKKLGETYAWCDSLKARTKYQSQKPNGGLSSGPSAFQCPESDFINRDTS